MRRRIAVREGDISVSGLNGQRNVGSFRGNFISDYSFRGHGHLPKGSMRSLLVMSSCTTLYSRQ